jgi:hypothetical protein
MAAQEYYNPGGIPQGPPQPAQPPQMQQSGPPRPAPAQAPQNPPYPLSDAPPPYSALTDAQRPQSQPPPQNRIPQQNGAPQYQPYNPNVDTHQYPPEKAPQRPSTLQNMYRPSDFTSSHPPPQHAQGPPPPPPQGPPNGYSQQPNGYFAPAGPGLSQIYNNQPRPPRRSSTSGYPTAQSPYRRSSRSRSRSRDRKHRHNHNRPQGPKQKGSGVNTFLGAGGGAIIGDLIFPGLGTIGGAILGGVGGHEYTKKRASSNPSRAHARRSGSNYGDYEEEGRRGRKY